MTDRVNLRDAIRLLSNKTRRPLSIDGREIYVIPRRGKVGQRITLDEESTVAMADIVSAIMERNAA